MLDAYRDLIDGLTEESTTLRELLGTPVRADLPAEGLTMLQLVRAREAVMLGRAQRIMRGEHVDLRAIEKEPRIVKAAEQEESSDDLLTGFLTDRGELVSLLINLTIKDWERKVPHWVHGETTLVDEIEEHLTWEEEILGQFEQLIG